MENEMRKEQTELKQHKKANDQSTINRTSDDEDEIDDNIFVDELSDDENVAAKMGVKQRGFEKSKFATYDF